MGLGKISQLMLFRPNARELSCPRRAPAYFRAPPAARERSEAELFFLISETADTTGVLAVP